MNIKALSQRLLRNLASVAFIVYAVTSFGGTFYKIFAERPYYFLVLIGLLAAFFAYYFYLLQHPEQEFVKRGKGGRILVFLILLANAAVQVTGGPASVLFPLYYLAVLFAVYRYAIRTAYYAVMGVALLEYGSVYFNGLFETAGVLVLIKLTFIVLIILIINIITSTIRRRHNMESRYELQASGAPGAPDSLAHLVPRLETGEMADIDRELYNTLASVLTLVNNLFQPHTCGIFYFDEESGEAVLYAHRSASTGIIPRARIKPGEGLVGLVLRERQPVIVGDVKQDSRTLRYYDSDDRVRSFLGAPLLVNKGLEGALVIDSLDKDAFDSDDQGVLINFCRMISSLIYKSRLMLDLKESTENLSEFYEISKMLNSRLYRSEVIALLTDLIHKMLPSDRQALCMYDPATREFTVKQVKGDPADMPADGRFALSDKGCVTRVFSNREISIIGDLEGGGRPIPRYRLHEDGDHGFRSFMGIPIVVEHEPIGVLCLESRAADRYADRDRERVTTVMNIAAMALAKAQLYQRMENLATVDGLTNLANHRHFQDMLAAEIRRARRHKLSIALLMIDIDYFKQINDNYGHQTGDQILKDIARIFTDTVREVDLVARYGGEEFAIILVGDENINAYLTAERIRKAVADAEFRHEHNTLRSLTISIGISQFPNDSETQSELIRLADRALYLAKDAGRDCIRTTRDLALEQ